MDEDIVYIHIMEYYCHKNEWNLATGNNMDRARKYSAKRNKSFRERQITIRSHLYVEFKKQNTWIKGKRERERQTKKPHFPKRNKG